MVRTRQEIWLVIMTLLMLLGGIGCTSSIGQGTGLITLTENSVRLEDQLTIYFENTTTQNIAILTTGCTNRQEHYVPLYTIEKRTGDQWSKAGSPICISIATPPIRLEPGENTSIQIPVNLGLEGENINGKFRYVFDIRTEKEGKYPADSELPKEIRTSPSFKITE